MNVLSYDFARSKVEEHSDRWAIFNVHYEPASAGYLDLAKSYDKTFMMAQGHRCIYGEEEHRFHQGAGAQPFVELLVDYQCNENGFLKYFTIDVGASRVKAHTYNPTTGQYRYGSSYDFSWYFDFGKPTPAPAPPPVTPAPSPPVTPAPPPPPVPTPATAPPPVTPAPSPLDSYPMDTPVLIKSHRGENLQDNDGNVYLTTNAQSWEIWTIVDDGDGKVVLRSHRNQHLQDNEGQVRMSPDTKDWEEWTIVGAGDGKFFIEGHRGQYLQDNNGNVMMSGNPGTWEMWSFVQP